MKYVDLVIDNKSNNTDALYTYGCQFDDIKVGQKVKVPFNRGNKIKDGYVMKVNTTLGSDIPNLKFVESIDEEISLTEEIMSTVEFMHSRYLCRYIDCIKLFLPAGKKAQRRKEGDPLLKVKGQSQNIVSLTEEQEAVLEEIYKAQEVETHERFLLYGVTSSGKTEVYIRAIEKAISLGKKGIMLVPEIALTKQIIDRFVYRFGKERLAVLHSKLTSGERYDQWQRIRNGQVDVIIGARGGVFAPMDNIGVIILDEEHESSYKSDMTPKYDTIEIALRRAIDYNGVVIIGSATPSVVSFKRSEDGIYKRLQLTKRYNNAKLPDIDVIDMAEEMRSGNMSIFGRRLFDGLSETINKGQQAILFINRRGFASFVSCRSCGYVVTCDNCNIPMKYHKDGDRGLCHYCGRSKPVPKVCPQCGSSYIKYFGAGTEKVEEEVKKFFPGCSVARLDSDATSKKGELNRILKDFGKGDIKVLVGTQLVAKGMDFKNVSLVGIIAADVDLNLPDYRSAERTFQLITQAAGRAGRGEIPGKVILQTYNKDSYPIRCAVDYDYEGFYAKEIEYRRLMDYPPFGHLVEVSVLGKDEGEVRDLIGQVKKSLVALVGDNIIGQKYTKKENGEVKGFLLVKVVASKKNHVIGLLTAYRNQLISKRSKMSLMLDVDPSSLWRN